MSNSIFVVLTEEGDLYYANIIENDGSGISHVSVFKKVNDEKVKDMYSIVNVDKFYGTYPYEYNSIYFETEKC